MVGLAYDEKDHLLSLADNIPGVAYQFRICGRDSYECLHVSKHAEGILGLSPVPDAFLSRVIEQIPVGYRNKMVGALKSAAEAEKRLDVRFPFGKPSGERIWLRNAAIPETVEGKVVFSGLLQNVTQRRTLEREVVATSDEERRRIGEELHDTLASKLAGATMVLRSVSASINGKAESVSDVLEDVVDRIKECVDHARRLSRSLTPLDIQHGTLADGIQGLAELHSQIRGLACSSTIEEDIGLPEDVATQLYRIGSEAVHNAVRHAEADHLDLFLKTEGDRVVLIVEDDGKGFQTEEVSDKHGLQLMWYRADLIGARLRITSTVGEGTRVECTLPQSRIPGTAEA